MKYKINTRTKARIKARIAALGSPDINTARRSEAILLRHYMVRAKPMLIAALKHEDPQIRFRASYILAHTHDPSLCSLLVPLIGDSDQQVRFEAAIALSILGKPTTNPLQIGPMPLWPQGDRADETPAIAFVVLRNTVVSAMLGLLESVDPDIRNVAIHFLGSELGAAAVASIGEMLNDGDDGVRLTALELLESIGGSKALAYVGRACKDPDLRVRECAVLCYQRMEAACTDEIAQDHGLSHSD